jgi:hypothetical protein
MNLRTTGEDVVEAYLKVLCLHYVKVTNKNYDYLG